MLDSKVEQIGKNGIQAKKAIQKIDDATSRSLLSDIADELERNTHQIIQENEKDLIRMSDADPKKDRLLLNEPRIRQLSGSLREIAKLDIPYGNILSEKTLANGLRVQKKSVPLGVVGVIYESRPNVTVDVAALCIRSGNACILRGGTDAYHTNTMLVNMIQKCLSHKNLDKNIVQLMPTDRELIKDMLSAVSYIDIIIPRGSQQLIDFVRNNSKIPVIETGAGVCHTYVESTADLDKAVNIVVNAKVSRPSVCNALDTILIDRTIYQQCLQALGPKLASYEVEIFADKESYEVLKNIQYPHLQAAEESDFGREFLDYKCSVKIVNGIDEALTHIDTFSSKHSEAILTENALLASRFMEEVDTAAVYVNASTRFTDGGEFGLGAEIGISTQKLHARGPFALEKLVTEKWYVYGNGQVR